MKKLSKKQIQVLIAHRKAEFIFAAEKAAAKGGELNNLLAQAWRCEAEKEDFFYDIGDKNEQSNKRQNPNIRFVG